MKTNLFVLIAIFFVLSACTLPEINNADLQKQVYDKVSEEFVVCSAFYSVVSADLKRSGKQKSAEEADDAMENAFGVALDLARQSNTEDNANSITWSRYQSSLEEMEKEAGKDYRNIPALRTKHSERCQWIMTSPAELVKEKENELKKK